VKVIEKSLKPEDLEKKCRMKRHKTAIWLGVRKND
jgi:hypothetical protein